MSASKNLAALIKKIEITRWDYITGSRSRMASAADLAQLSLRKYELCNLKTSIGKVFGMPIPKNSDGTDFSAAEQRLMYHHMKHNASGRTSVLSDLYNSAKTIGAWEKAYAANDFNVVAPQLAQSLQGEYAALEHSRERLLWETADNAPQSLMDVALDKKTEGLRSQQIVQWGELLKPFCQELLAKQKMFQATQRYLRGDAFAMPAADQEKLVRLFLQKVGYDETRGKIAAAPHPICLGRNDDVRIGYKIDERNFLNTLLSTAHEAGHAFYRQNLPEEHKDELCGDIAGNVVDEGMALLFENVMFRSKAGAQFIYDFVSRELGEPYKSRWNAQMIFKHMIKLEPDGIRAKADDVRYPLDILHRHEVLFNMYFLQDDVNSHKEYWNEYYEKLTGITPKDDRSGILQDIHLYSGEASWLPTYLPGRLAASQFAEAFFEINPKQRRVFGEYHGIDRDLKALDGLKDWLRTNVCQEGARLKPLDLIEHVTGKPLLPDSYMLDVAKKYEPPRMPVVAVNGFCL